MRALSISLHSFPHESTVLNRDASRSNDQVTVVGLSKRRLPALVPFSHPSKGLDHVVVRITTLQASQGFINGGDRFIELPSRCVGDRQGCDH